QLTSAEYFFDKDPGVGKGTALTVTSGDSVSFSGNISSTGLSNGFHFLNIRTKNNKKAWSIAERRLFYIKPITATPSLTAAEYYFDTDPGTGNGTAITVTGTDSIVFSGSIPSTSLNPGFHFLNIRVKSTDGKWSNPERRLF